MIIKQAFKVTKDNIILAQPLVLYLVVVSLTSAGLSRVPASPVFWVFFGANILLSTAFFAGWFYMCAKTVEHEKTEYKSPEEKSIASVKLIKNFFRRWRILFVCYIGDFALYGHFCDNSLPRIQGGYAFYPESLYKFCKNNGSPDTRTNAGLYNDPDARSGKAFEPVVYVYGRCFLCLYVFDDVLVPRADF